MVQKKERDLELNYRAYQALLLAIDLKNIEYVDNSFNESYTNGVIEGVNNFIKIMKRVAF